MNLPVVSRSKRGQAELVLNEPYGLLWVAWCRNSRDHPPPHPQKEELQAPLSAQGPSCKILPATPLSSSDP